MTQEQGFEKITEILENYDKKDSKIFNDTIDELCKKGIPNGCYQNNTVLLDVVSILTICENIIINKE